MRPTALAHGGAFEGSPLLRWSPVPAAPQVEAYKAFLREKQAVEAVVRRLREEDERETQSRMQKQRCTRSRGGGGGE